MYHAVHQPHKMPHRKKPDLQVLLDRCLAAFVEAGTLDVSLDDLGRKVGTSKRMLVHYFGGRENLEEQAITRLESRLRQQFAPEAFPPGATAHTVITALWDRTTAPQSKGVLLLIMDLSKRAWSGSKRAKLFYEQQQHLWVELLLRFLPDRATVEEVLQTFQGAVLAFLITGDREPGKRAILRILQNQKNQHTRP
ncbi:MAG TPA: TetR family transcriptional regulator [Candidatus Sulfotelmatobacter sp.]|nr:TetR family transcriptional regulator [Candidatus Sulfotelmatobacter sp.]